MQIFQARKTWKGTGLLIVLSLLCAMIGTLFCWTAGWHSARAQTVYDTAVTAFGDPDTEQRQNQFLWFTLSNNDYENYNTAVNNTQLDSLNLGEKIKLTIDGVEKTLGEYTKVENAELYKFVRAGKPIALHTSITDYTTIEKVTVEAGCQFPSEATASAASGFTVYQTTESVTFKNDGTGAFYKDVPLADTDTSITGVQLRGDVGSQEFFLVLQTEQYATLTETVAVNSPANYAELLSKITFYLNDGDTEGVSAADVCLSGGWVMNQWISQGLMLPISAETYETYNGSSVYKVTVSEGARLPFVDANLVTGETVTYLNNGYGFDECKNESFSWSKDTLGGGAIPLVNMYITGVQLRAEPSSEIYYFVVTAENYAGVADGALVAQTGRFTDLLSKIRLYTSEEDTVGVSAAEICKPTGWTMNRWDSHGVMFPMTAESYALYNGTTVYKVAIEANAVFPGDGCKLMLYEECTYVNSTYGKEDSRDNGYYWSAVPSTIYNFGACTPTDMNNRSNSVSGERWLFLFFAETFEKTQDVSGWLNQLNTLDYIEFYPTDDVTQTPISLREVYTGFTVVKQFGQNTAMTFTIAPEYSGANMYLLRIKSGCQIPYVENGKCGFRVLEKGKSFINDKYGETGDIFGMYDEMGMPRTYENWGVWWTAVQQVSFRVEGVDGWSYPTRIIAAGDVIDLKDFAIDGYTVSLTTAEGDRCIGGYIMPSWDTELILTYTPATEEEEKSGCGSAVGFSVLPIAIAAVALLGRKKEEQA